VLVSASKSPLAVSVVVHYGAVEPTIFCVRSLLDIDYPQHQIVIVDNASPEAEAATLKSTFGDLVDIVTSPRNLGYGAGANLGIRKAFGSDASYVWVLNNDTVIPSDAVRRLVGTMEANPVLGAISPQIAAPIGPEAPSGVWFAGGSVDLARGLTQHSSRALQPLLSAASTGYVTGCAMFLRCSALREVGLFWEPLFLFWEDTDLSLRLERAGWQLGVAPQAWIRHEIHGSVASPTVSYYYIRNAIVVAGRLGSRSVAAHAAAVWSAKVARRWVAALLRRRRMPTAETRGLLAGICIAASTSRMREPSSSGDVSNQPGVD
jgi:GT2 family glycosyltransferase